MDNTNIEFNLQTFLAGMDAKAEKAYEMLNEKLDKIAAEQVAIATRVASIEQEHHILKFVGGASVIAALGALAESVRHFVMGS